MTIQNPHDETLKSNYKTFKNRVISQLRNADIQYFNNELEINKSDSSKSWRVLKTIIGKDSNSCKQKLSFVINNNTTYKSQTIANEFNDFFVSIGSQLASTITSTVNPLSYVTPVVNSIVILDMTTTEVMNIIQSLNNSSPG